MMKKISLSTVKKFSLKERKIFFLNPGESIEQIQNVMVLMAEEALDVLARENFKEEIQEGKKTTYITRCAGEKWLEVGPKEYWPPVEVEVSPYRKRAIFVFEPLKIYVFRKDKVALTVFGILLMLYLLMRLFR